MKKKTKKAIIYFISFLLGVVYAYYLYKLFWNIGYNSDSACFVLEGNDIFKGNILLNGWNLTGISFAFSDLLFYALGVAVSGVSQKASVIAAFVPYFLLIVLSGCLIYEEKQKDFYILKVIFLMAIAGVPCLFLMDKARFHTASIIECLLAIEILKAFKEVNKKRRKYIIYFISFFLFSFACMSDAAALLLVVAPFVLVNLWRVVAAFLCDKKINPEYVRNSLLGIGAIVNSFLLDKIYFLVGTANKNSFLGDRKFLPLEEYHDKLLLYIKSVFGMFDANYFDTPMITIRTVFVFVRVLVVLLGMFCVFYSLYREIRYKDTDIYASILSLGIILMSFVFIVTNIGIDEGSARYMGTFPALFCIVIVRTISAQKINEIKKFVIIKSSLIVIFGSLLLYTIGTNKIGNGFILSKQTELATVLHENGLVNGYGSFWNAASTTVLSNDKVHVRAVVQNINGIGMYNWFCKSEWYQNSANFVVTEPDDLYGITEKCAKKVFGEPAKEINVSDYKVLVYDYNINSVINSFSDGVLKPSEWYKNEYVDIKDDKLVLNEKGMLTGPYGILSAGDYIVNCHGSNLSNIYFDVYSNDLGCVIHEKEKIGEDYQFEFAITKTIADLEIRIYNDDDAVSELEYFEIQQK